MKLHLPNPVRVPLSLNKFASPGEVSMKFRSGPQSGSPLVQTTYRSLVALDGGAGAYRPLPALRPPSLSRRYSSGPESWEGRNTIASNTVHFISFAILYISIWSHLNGRFLIYIIHHPASSFIIQHHHHHHHHHATPSSIIVHHAYPASLITSRFTLNHFLTIFKSHHFVCRSLPPCFVASTSC